MSRYAGGDDAPAMTAWPRSRARGAAVLSVLMAVVFTVLRLAHVTDWQWALVLSPLWAGGLVILLADLITAAVFGPWDSTGDDP